MGRAVVAGGGFAGLCAARVLARHFDEVVLLDKGTGSGQGSQLHVLLQRGRLALERLFPGLDAELARRGCLEIDWAADTLWIGRHGAFPRYASDVRTRSCSWTLLESILRERVLADRRIRAERFEAAGFEARAVVGVTGGRVEGELVVNATGRLGPARAAPVAEEIDSGVGYASCLIRLHDAARFDFKQAYVQLCAPRDLRGGVVIPIEDGLHLLTLVGAAGDRPSAGVGQFQEFAASLRHPVISRVLEAADPIGPVRSYRRTAARRVPNPGPAGVVTLGDACCAFNPVYGQGMTVAALGALELDRQLAEKRRIAGRRLARLSRLPWMLGASEDLRVRGCRTRNVDIAFRASAKVSSLVFSAFLLGASRSTRLHRAFLRALHLMMGQKGAR